jgi:hypothetical protein
MNTETENIMKLRRVKSGKVKYRPSGVGLTGFFK